MGMAGMCYENNRVGSLPHVQIVRPGMCTVWSS